MLSPAVPPPPTLNHVEYHQAYRLLSRHAASLCRRPALLAAAGVVGRPVAPTLPAFGQPLAAVAPLTGPMPALARCASTLAPPSTPDLYATLGVPRTATSEEIKDAFRSLGTFFLW